jgi:hypothetical protein
MMHSQIISAKGAKVIADRLAIPAGRVRVWKTRNVIPRSAWAELIDAYPDVTLEALKAGEHHRPAANDTDPHSEAA